MKSYKTERLLLRPFRSDDVNAAYDYIGNHENTKYTRAGMQTKEQCAEFINSISEDEYIFAVEYDGKLIGTAELAICEDNQATLGWIIHRDYWGHGFCTEIGKQLLSIAFDELKLRRVMAFCDTENIGSWRVMEKIGMRREGCFIGGRPAYSYALDRHSDEYSYAILAEEYLSSKA
ncbi:MAG: GNAT family N-acetyltransferase [Clostridiales bacterium]|nr:GNAT family N-acetyltransferase [Clostridiales bacterium]